MSDYSLNYALFMEMSVSTGHFKGHYHDPARGVSAVDGTNKAKIERAALSLFAEHGVDGVSTKSIAQQAAVRLLEGAMAEGVIAKRDANVLASMALGVVLQPAQAKVLGAIKGPLSAHIDSFTTGVLALIGLEA